MLIPYLKSEDVIFFVVLDGLADDVFDRVQEDLLRSLFGADPQLRTKLSLTKTVYSESPLEC